MLQRECVKKQLSKTEVETINIELHGLFGKDFLTKKQRVELFHDKARGVEIVIVDSVPCFFKNEGSWLPHLKFLLINCFLKCVSVDTGAIPFVVKGADIMRPGIVWIEEGVLANELVVVIDEVHKKPLSVGRMLFSSADANHQIKGKIIQNLHWVGDEIWKA